MPAIVAWIVSGLSVLFRNRIGQWVVAAMAFLGLELASRTFLVGPILAQIQAVASGAGGPALEWIAFFNVDRYITILLSAYAVASAKGVLLRRRGGG